ncbi:hypothetical protein C8R41DRAFT_837516 [Lentinula lateritia]|uniref:TEA domain-containing protein n=1 Tax=Lentinula lateritia TaxID=40482 RepID=A0ABQ8VFZ4_9AGAR|nr:hypothetical protein C8R41DRAFT_837516 [Lentinula lateritia]
MVRGTQASPRDGSYTRSSAKEATEIVLAARKTWKLMRSKREKVWPPLIEATLIEALQKYRPQSVTDIQLLQRFPKRNCWISRYIKRRTGHDRSPKQVGSRLQQLRDSCRDERILQLLSRKQYDDNDDNDSVTSCSTSLDSFGSTPPSESIESPHSSSPISLPSPGTGPEVYPNDASALEAQRHTLVRIELTSPLSHSSCSPISFNTISSDREIGPTIVCVDLKLASLVTTLFSWKNPMISLHSARVLDVTEHHCLFKVFLDGVMVHLDRTQIGLQSTSAQTRNGTTRQMYLYETKFLPKYWTKCFSSVDLACCEVHQCLIKRRLISDNDEDFLSLKEHHEDEVVQTVRYTFVDLRSTPPSTPSDEPAELWTPPMEEASHESPLNGSVTHSLDALGLDAPAVLPQAEFSGDGRAHFPVKEESHTPPSQFSPLSQDLSDGMPEPPVHSTQCLYDDTQLTTYEFDFSTSSSVNDMPALVYPSTYTATAFTPRCNHPLTFSSTEWLPQGQWTGQAQGYRPQHPDTMSNPHDKRYAYFWEQPILYADISSYQGQSGHLSYASTASETQETQEPYAYAQPDYMTTPEGTAHLDHSNDSYQRQDDQKMREGPCAVNANVSHSLCSDSSSELAYAPETLMTNSAYSHLPPPPYICAPGNESGYQMCSPAQAWS